jgi:hypothetical protein
LWLIVKALAAEYATMLLLVGFWFEVDGFDSFDGDKTNCVTRGAFDKRTIFALSRCDLNKSTNQNLPVYAA